MNDGRIVGLLYLRTMICSYLYPLYLWQASPSASPLTAMLL